MVVHETYHKKDGTFVTPAEVKIEASGNARSATLIATGEPVVIGGIEKMSKSKRNTVDPDEIIGTYGADVARWFMLSDSPPERDIEWTEEGVQARWTFMQKLWRIVGEMTEIAQKAPAGRPAQFSDRAIAIRKAAHGALSKVSEDIDKLRFNRCVAHIYEFSNTLSAAIGETDDGNKDDASFAYAMKEAAGILVQLFHPMMPHLAEECWAALGHKNLVAMQAWPKVEAALLVEDTMSLPVQVNGKKRDELTIKRDATNAEIEAAVLTLDGVKRALEGKAPKKVIVVPQRIVNVVV
jgi:leucyl-tRNA synthetase